MAWARAPGSEARILSRRRGAARERMTCGTRQRRAVGVSVPLRGPQPQGTNMSRMNGRLLAACVCVVLSSTAAAAASVKPQVFAPGVISGPAAEDSAAFTPDGNTVFFDRVRWPNAAILVSHRTAEGWSVPVVAPFSGRWLDQ